MLQVFGIQQVGVTGERSSHDEAVIISVLRLCVERGCRLIKCQGWKHLAMGPQHEGQIVAQIRGPHGHGEAMQCDIGEFLQHLPAQHPVAGGHD